MNILLLLLFCITASITVHGQTATNQLAQAKKGLAIVDARLNALRSANAKLQEQIVDLGQIRFAKQDRTKDSAEAKEQDRLRAVQRGYDVEIRKLTVTRAQLTALIHANGGTVPAVKPLPNRLRKSLKFGASAAPAAQRCKNPNKTALSRHV